MADSPLARPSFRRLTAAWTSANIADSALYLVLAIWVKDLTGNDAAAASVFIFLALPAFLAPLTGRLADAMSRRRLMIITNGSVALTVSSLLLVHDASGVWIIYAVTLIYGTAQYLVGASQAGLIRDMLPDNEIASANGLFTTIDQGLRILAPLLGTGLYVWLGAHAVALLTAGAFACAGAILLTLHIEESPIVSDGEGPGSMWHGFRLLYSHLELRRATIAIAIAFGITGLLNIVVFPLIEQGLGLPASALGPIQSVQGLGAVIGGITAPLAIRRLGEYRVVGVGLGLLALCVTGVCAAILTLTPGEITIVAIACFAWFIGGSGIAWTLVAASTLRIRLTPGNLQGRASAAMNMSINLPQTLVMILGAGLVLTVDFRVLLIACTLVLGATTLMLRPWRRAPARVS